MSGPIADEKYDAAQREFRAAATAMEKLANRVIERLIRQGYASRSDVEKLRAGDRRARAALAALECLGRMGNLSALQELAGGSITTGTEGR